MMAAALVGCTDTPDDQPIPPTPTRTKMNFATTVGDYTRATDTAFEEGDQVGLHLYYGDTYYLQNTLLTYAGGTLAAGSDLYWYEGEASSNIVAYYPYTTAWNTFGLGEFYWWQVAPDQSTEEGAAISDFMLAVTTATPTADPVALNFKHEMSKVVFKFDNQLGEAIREVQFGEVCTYLFLEMNLSATTLEGVVTRRAPAEVDGTEGYSGIIFASNMADTDSYDTWQLLLPPQGNVNPKLVIVTESQKVYEYVLEGATTFEAGKRSTATLTLELPEEPTPTPDPELIEVEWAISDWNAGGELVFEPVLDLDEGDEEKLPVVVNALLCGETSKTWRMASHEPGHLACGENAWSPANWWSAPAEDKAGTGLYDDRITFAADGTYTYNPGEDGLTYVNYGATLFNTTGAGADFDMANTVQTSCYTLLESDTQLQLAANTFMPYVANDIMYTEPLFLISTLEENKLVISQYNGPSISWQMIFVPEDFVVEEDPDAFDPGAKIEDTSLYAQYLVGVWTWESSTHAHMGCGDSIWNPAGWWAAGADEKAGCSFYDDEMTFSADGNYTFNPVDGKTYANNGVTADYVTIVESMSGDNVVSAEQMSGSYSFTTEGECPSFTLDEGLIFSYIPNNLLFTTDRTFYITGMWENQMEVSWYTATGNGGGPIAWRYRLKLVPGSRP